MRQLAAACVAALTCAATGAYAADDATMRALAAHSGCTTCHAIEAKEARGPAGLSPIGPAWREVAAKYRGDPKAAETLTRTVMTGSNPYASHWKGKVSGLAMPPNEVAIGRDEARRLVEWILALPAS